MGLGAMRERLLLEQPTETRGTSGGVSASFAPLATVWAEHMPSRGREFFAARGLLAEKHAVFRIRYRSDITAKHRAQFNGAIYNIIDAIQENAGMKRYLLIYCASGAIATGA